MIQSISGIRNLILAFTVLVNCSPILAATPLADILRCTAFEPSAETTRAEIVYNRTLEDANQSGVSDDEGLQTAVVRASVKELSSRADWSQHQKAAFWKAVVELLKVRSGYPFISDEFAGSDGSILFQGGHAGTALAIKPNGDVYRGALKQTLDERRSPRPIWKANYTDFVLVSRSPLLQIDTSK